MQGLAPDLQIRYSALTLLQHDGLRFGEVQNPGRCRRRKRSVGLEVAAAATRSRRRPRITLQHPVADHHIGAGMQSRVAIGTIRRGPLRFPKLDALPRRPAVPNDLAVQLQRNLLHWLARLRKNPSRYLRFRSEK